MEKSYKNFISLGYFCSVALELERFGLRNTSSPFDWCLSNFEKDILLIKNSFAGFFDFDNFYQLDNNPSLYCNIKFKILFYHDFVKYKSLKRQFKLFKEKYTRRISRFLENIKSPTLFIRYINDNELDNNGRSIELVWIEKNIDYIMSVLKSFNPLNDIIFIINNTQDSETIPLFKVQKDENDLVARFPTEKNIDLLKLLMNFDYPERENNIKRYKDKKKKKHYLKRGIKKVKSLIFKEYRHNKICDSNYECKKN